MLTNEFCNIAKNNGLCNSETRLGIYLKDMFSDCGHLFRGNRVIDIGGGKGLFTFYVGACCKAREVICLEPEGDGSQSGMVKAFQNASEQMGLKEVTKLKQISVQDYTKKATDKFDIAILHNSINHLDEQCCIDLHKNAASREKYINILESIRCLLKDRSKIIIVDCARKNIFSSFGLKNPFAPTIEWHKHQSPELWSSLLAEAGYCNPRISWNCFPYFYALANITKLRWINYCVCSHFRLIMDTA